MIREKGKAQKKGQKDKKVKRRTGPFRRKRRKGKREKGSKGGPGKRGTQEQEQGKGKRKKREVVPRERFVAQTWLQENRFVEISVGVVPREKIRRHSSRVGPGTSFPQHSPAIKKENENRKVSRNTDSE